MNIYSLSIPLQVGPEHTARLKSLQEAFASVCNALAPVVKETRCWNRVALHHMMYKTLRENFPQLGSQMVCNAIYSVSRTSRLVFQSQQSPFNIQLLGEKPLPLLQFLPSAPVYFDRHTLSLKAGSLSMFTLDGRMRFELNMSAEDLNRFKTMKLHEIILQSNNNQYTLSFSFGTGVAGSATSLGAQGQQGHQASPELEAEDVASRDSFWPEYVVIDQAQHPEVSQVQSDSPIPTNSTRVNAELKVNCSTHLGIQLKLHSSTNSSRQVFTAAVPLRSNDSATSTSSLSSTQPSSQTISILPLGATP
jgi:hypothetical protein